MRLWPGKKGLKPEEEEKHTDTTSKVNERSSAENPSREINDHLGVVAYNNTAQREVWSHTQTRHSPENGHIPFVEAPFSIARKPLPIPGQNTLEDVNLEEENFDLMPSRRSISISGQNGTPPKADVNGKRQRPLPGLPKAEVRQPGSFTNPNANLANGLWRCIGHIPQSSDDQTIIAEVRKTFTLVNQHVDNFYADKLQNDLPRLRELEAMKFSNLPAESSLASLLHKVTHPTTIIKHCLLVILLSTILFDSNSSFPSLLPDEFTALPYASHMSTARDGEIPHARAAAAAHRVLTYYLRRNLDNDKHHIAMQDQAVDRLIELIESSFSPWQADDKKLQDRQLNLGKVLQNTANLGILLYSQASTFSFDWTAQYSPASSNMNVPIMPRVYKMTDEDANAIHPPQLMLSQKTEATWFWSDAQTELVNNAHQPNVQEPLYVGVNQVAYVNAPYSSTPPADVDQHISSSVNTPQNIERYIQAPAELPSAGEEIQNHTRKWLNEFRQPLYGRAALKQPHVGNKGHTKPVVPAPFAQDFVKPESFQAPSRSQTSERYPIELENTGLANFGTFHTDVQPLNLPSSSDGPRRKPNDRIPLDHSVVSGNEQGVNTSRPAYAELPPSAVEDPKVINQFYTSHTKPHYDNVPRERPSRSSTDPSQIREGERSKHSPQRRAGTSMGPTSWKDGSRQQDSRRSRSRTSSVSSDTAISVGNNAEDNKAQSSRFRSSSMGRSLSSASQSSSKYNERPSRSKLGSFRNMFR